MKNTMEYKGYINRDAKEEISLDTICGTSNKIAPTAKGMYYRSSDGLQIKQMTRQGRTNLVEKLLIGTLYSQFATRHTKLSGTAFLMEGDLKLYRDAMQSGKKFLMLADLQDVDAGTSEMSAVELTQDEYDAIEYEGDKNDIKTALEWQSSIYPSKGHSAPAQGRSADARPEKVAAALM